MILNCYACRAAGRAERSHKYIVAPLINGCNCLPIQ